jgi:hypothetical protein
MMVIMAGAGAVPGITAVAIADTATITVTGNDKYQGERSLSANAPLDRPGTSENWYSRELPGEHLNVTLK